MAWRYFQSEENSASKQNSQLLFEKHFMISTISEWFKEKCVIIDLWKGIADFVIEFS